MLNKGIALDKSGKNDEAIKCFNKALEINPNKEEALVNKGAIFVDEYGKYDEGIMYFDMALEINPNKEEALVGKGVVLIKSDKQEAIRYFDKALEINPNSGSARYNSACAYSIKGKKEKAIFNLKMAIEIDLSNKEKAKNDPEFENLWADEVFQKLVV